MPIEKNTRTRVTNSVFSHRKGIFPNTPPSVPPIANAWNKVSEVLERALSLLLVQNIFAFIANRMPRKTVAVNG